MRPMFVRIFDDSLILWWYRVSTDSGRATAEIGAGTHGEQLEGVVKLFRVVCSQCRGPYF